MPGGIIQVIASYRPPAQRRHETGMDLKARSTRSGPQPESALAQLRRELLAVGCCAAMVLLPAGGSHAQDRSGGGRASALGATSIAGPSPRLEVPSVIIAAPASETSLGIAIGRNGALPANTYIRVRGMSPMMALTSGHVIAPGAWAVPVAALPNLRVVIPAGAAGKSEVHVALVAIDGGVISEAQTTLVVAAAALDSAVRAKPQPAPAAPSVSAPPPPASATPQAQPPSPAPQGPPAAKGPSLSAADRQHAEGFLSRGRKLLESGDIVSARLFFRRAADAGLADGALAMGDTFDPIELRRLNAIGIRPDAAEARQWYEKARELGAGISADRRLERFRNR